MNVHLLIDAIVRQTTVLIAQLATSGGARAPLAHVANQVFMDLAAELERQGLSRQVTADMFGISLRSYQRKVQRLRESSTDRGTSMWEAVLGYLGDTGVVTRADVLERFHRDPEKLVGGILRDLVDSGLVFCSGTGLQAIYRVASEEELAAVRRASSVQGLEEFLWAHIYRHGPVSKAQLTELVAAEDAEVDAALAALTLDGRVTLNRDAADLSPGVSSGGPTESATPTYSAARLVVGVDAKRGWEASVYDHFQALVSTIGARLTTDDGSPYAPFIGGSTYSFDVGPEHPLREEVLSTLQRFRDRCSDLRTRIAEHNERPGNPAPTERVVVYAGQTVLAGGDDADATTE